MADRPKGFRRLMAAAIVLVALVLAAAVYVWRDDILRTRLDPKEPFQTYDPPPAPDYAQRSAWALMPNAPEAPTAGEPPPTCSSSGRRPSTAAVIGTRRSTTPRPTACSDR